MVTNGMFLYRIVQSIDQNNPVVAQYPLQESQATDTGLAHLDGGIGR